MLSLALLAACGSESSNGVDIKMYEDAFKNEGLEIEEDKPLFGIIGAKDGFILYNEGKKVAVYEFENTKDIKVAEKSLPAMKDWERNGLFVLETSHEESKKIFNSVK